MRIRKKKQLEAQALAAASFANPCLCLLWFGICWMASQVTVPDGSTLRTYVGNFSWLGTLCLVSANFFQAAGRFCSALSLPMDWKKSYSWEISAAGWILKWPNTRPGQRFGSVFLVWQGFFAVQNGTQTRRGFETTGNSGTAAAPCHQ